MVTARQKKATGAASAKALDALARLVREPGTEAARSAAEAVIHLRKQFEHDGMPDWAGRSTGYRDLIERLYRQAEVPSDSESNVQANLRYHIGNTLRKIAPPEDLSALGMSVESPLSRIRSSRATSPRRPKARAVTVSVHDPAVLLSLALTSVQTVGAMTVGNGDAASVEAGLRQVIDEAVSVLTNLRG